MNIIFLSIALLFASVSFAKTTTKKVAINSTSEATSIKVTAPTVTEDHTAYRGFRFSLFKPIYRTYITVNVKNPNNTNSGAKFSISDSVESDIAGSFGYVYHPANSFGGNANIAIIDFENEAQLVRLDANLVYSVGRHFNLKAGPNFSKFFGNSSAQQWSTDIGLQAGLGYQFYKNLGVDATYSVMRQKKSLLINEGFGDINETIRINTRGVEIGVHATF